MNKNDNPDYLEQYVKRVNLANPLKEDRSNKEKLKN